MKQITEELIASTEAPSGVGLSEHLFADRVLLSDHGKFHSQGPCRRERAISPGPLGHSSGDGRGTDEMFSGQSDLALVLLGFQLGFHPMASSRESDSQLHSLLFPLVMQSSQQLQEEERRKREIRTPRTLSD